jgi:hypothetical protein
MISARRARFSCWQLARSAGSSSLRRWRRRRHALIGRRYIGFAADHQRQARPQFLRQVGDLAAQTGQRQLRGLRDIHRTGAVGQDDGRRLGQQAPPASRTCQFSP